MITWNDVFSANLGKMMAIQIACGELVVKNKNWNVDFDKGIIAFGNDEYPLQFLGSEANSSNRTPTGSSGARATTSWRADGVNSNQFPTREFSYMEKHKHRLPFR